MIQTGEGLFGRLSEKRKKIQKVRGGWLGSTAAEEKNLLGLGFFLLVLCFPHSQNCPPSLVLS